MIPLTVTLTQKDNFTKCIMRADALNLHIYPVITEMNNTQQILTLHVCSTNESESEEFLVDKTLSQVCYTDKEKSKYIIANESSTGER